MLLNLLFGKRNIARIKFPDKVSEIKGLALLTLGDHSIRFYKDDVGLTSSEQIALLKQNNIPFELVE